MHKARTIEKRAAYILLVAVMAVTMTCAYWPYGAAADTDTALAATSVSGLYTTRSRNYKTATNMYDNIVVHNAYGRTAYLYAYDYDQKQWVEKSSYPLDNAESSSIRITYDNSWKPYYYSAWKLVIPADSTYAAYSRKIKVYNKASLTCRTAVVIDASTGKIVYNKYSTKKRYPASMTKVMTSILLLENKSLSSRIKITAEADNTPWGLGISKGDSLTTKQALYAILLPSSNDVACAAGIAVSGSTSRFTKRMTAKAKKFGCRNTNFKNAHGLYNSSHYTTAYDMGLIMKYAMTSSKTKYFKTVIKKSKYTFTTGKKRKYTVYTTDEMLGASGFLGGKTGWIEQSGGCFTGAFTYNGKMYITVVMGSDSGGGRFSDTKRLITFTKYAVDNSYGVHSTAK